ncbi:MAG: thiamine phosphate synthase [Alistipes sp.]|jgi:thiamine-phosphate pyrophosphorylase|nr:thiamine phosphate synthase [Alistipes sp.]
MGDLERMADFGLYVIITSPRLSYRQVAEVCVARGIGMLQLREKGLDDKGLLKAAAEILAVTRGTATRFVMNDRADLAFLAGADVLHLGQGDVSLADARRIVGDGMTIGLSTHSPEQARQAIADGADYIGFGPVWPTPTKTVPDPAVGLEQLAEVIGFSPVPVVAIGGIFPENLDGVLAAGTKNPCLVRHLMESPDVETLDSRIAELQSRINNNQKL